MQQFLLYQCGLWEGLGLCLHSGILLIPIWSTIESFSVGCFANRRGLRLALENSLFDFSVDCWSNPDTWHLFQHYWLLHLINIDRVEHLDFLRIHLTKIIEDLGLVLCKISLNMCLAQIDLISALSRVKTDIRVWVPFTLGCRLVFPHHTLSLLTLNDQWLHV